MNYNRLGQTDLRVSELGLGCQSLGGGLFHCDKKESIKVVRRALDEGVNFFDTSDHYSHGLSELWLGEALKGRRQDVILATKAGMRYTRLGDLGAQIRPALRPFSRYLRPFKVHIHRMRATLKQHEFSPAYLTRAVNASLKRLNTDYLDLFQLHKPSASELVAGGWHETLERLREVGKIRYYGISCATVNDAMLCLDKPGVASVQVGISLLDQEAIAKFVGRAQKQSLGVIVRNPRAQGHLTTELCDIMAETYAKNNTEVTAKIRGASRFSFLAKDNRTLPHAALQFVLQLPGVTTAIPRAINVQQLMENLGALKATPLAVEEVERILTSSPENCTG